MHEVDVSSQDIQRDPGMIEVTVLNANDIDEALAQAIHEVSKAAREHMMGIMVTRVAAGQYIVRARPEVPFGLTRQRHD